MSRGGLLACLPVLVLQGRGVRRRVEQLPVATGTSGRTAEPGGPHEEPIRIVVLGDSVAAGVGVADHRYSMAGRLAERLHQATGRGVAWQVEARSGADSSEVAALARRSIDLELADLVVISVGVNDVKGLRSDAAFASGLRALLEHSVRTAPRARVILLGLPPMERFPALPRPLADLLGARARRLDRVGARVAAEFPGVIRVPLALGSMAESVRPFAGDGFHPSAELHDLIARDVAVRLGSLDRSERTENE